MVAYNIKGPPVAIAKIININRPLDGSDAKACTEVNNPDLTINVPNKENEKASIDSRIVQFIKINLTSSIQTE